MMLMEFKFPTTLMSKDTKISFYLEYIRNTDKYEKKIGKTPWMKLIKL